MRAAACLHRLMAMVLVLCCAQGCVQRRMTIRSNPPGAFVYVDDYEIGITPCSTDYIYYGTRQFRLVREGYETLTVEKKIGAPWYDWYGIDFVTENLVPFEIRDERTLDFTLLPQRLISQEQLVANGDQLRQGNQPAAYLAPLNAPAASPGMPPVFTPGQGAAPLPGQPGAPVFGPGPYGADPQLPPGWSPYPVVPRAALPRAYYPSEAGQSQPGQPLPVQPAPQLTPLPAP